MDLDVPPKGNFFSLGASFLIAGVSDRRALREVVVFVVYSTFLFGVNTEVDGVTMLTPRARGEEEDALLCSLVFAPLAGGSLTVLVVDINDLDRFVGVATSDTFLFGVVSSCDSDMLEEEELNDYSGDK
jgi:hypothetical protein